MAIVSMFKFSFILPCYNVGRYIAGCLDSLFTQDIPEEQYEVICVNDCSTDNTREVIQSYAAKHPNLTLIDHTENLTAGGARNTGIRAASGEYIWFVDPDDAVKPDCLQALYAKAKETDADVLFFNYDDADEEMHVRREDRTYPDSRVYRGQEYVSKFFPNRFSTFGIIWREIYKAAFLKGSGLQYPVMRKAQDVVFLWKVMLCAEKVCSVSAAYYTYRSNPYSVTKHETLARVAFSDRILRAREIVKMLGGNDILPGIREDMLRNLRWCACSNVELFLQMSQAEKEKYYHEITRNKEAVKVVRPYMNWKNKILFDSCLGIKGWRFTTGLLCKFEQRKRR